jgi:hypothetical protein
VIVDEPADALLERLATEVDEQPDRLLGQSQIGQQLLCMHRTQLVDRFDLKDQSLVHQQIDTEGGSKTHSFEFDVYRTLSFHAISHRGELARQDGS